MGHVFAKGFDDNTELNAINQADVVVVDPAAALTELFDVGLFPDADEGKAVAPSPHTP